MNSNAMSRRAEEPDAQLVELQEERDTGSSPSLYSVSPQTARRQFANVSQLSEFIEDDPAETADFDIPGPDGDISLRAYIPEADEPRPIVIFYHGGGFVIGDLNTHESLCMALCDRGDFVVLSVDYRLAPEHQFPAPHADAYAALKWAATHGEELGGDTENISVAGTSAGGNLAASVSILARDNGDPPIKNQVLIYPWLDPVGRFSLPSYEENSEESADDEQGSWFYNHLVSNNFDKYNQLLAPLIADDLSNVPPAIIVTAGFDALRDEGFEYASQLKEAGVPTTLHNYPSLDHAFCLYLGLVDKADAAVNQIVEDLSR